MTHPCSDGSPGITKLECTKFNEGCTKFCEGCTKGSKVCSEMGINPQSFPYVFQNEIMGHPCSNGGPGIFQIGFTKFNEGYTQFNEGCTEFCEGCSKGLKMRYEVVINRKSLYYGFLN